MRCSTFLLIIFSPICLLAQLTDELGQTRAYIIKQHELCYIHVNDANGLLFECVEDGDTAILTYGFSDSDICDVCQFDVPDYYWDYCQNELDKNDEYKPSYYISDCSTDDQEAICFIQKYSSDRYIIEFLQNRIIAISGSYSKSVRVKYH